METLFTFAVTHVAGESSKTRVSVHEQALLRRGHVLRANIARIEPARLRIMMGFKVQRSWQEPVGTAHCLSTKQMCVSVCGTPKSVCLRMCVCLGVFINLSVQMSLQVQAPSESVKRGHSNPAGNKTNSYTHTRTNTLLMCVILSLNYTSSDIRPKWLFQLRRCECWEEEGQR